MNPKNSCPDVVRPVLRKMVRYRIAGVRWRVCSTELVGFLSKKKGEGAPDFGWSCRERGFGWGLFVLVVAGVAFSGGGRRREGRGGLVRDGVKFDVLNQYKASHVLQELRDIAATEAVKGKHFFLETDIKGPSLKLDNTGKAILTVSCSLC